MLSGYCLMLPVVLSPQRTLRSGYWQFMARRARRILPPYDAALAVSIMLIVLVPSLADPSIGEWHKSFPALSVGAVVSHLALVHNYFAAHQYAINHPLWSIATEWQMYLLFPGLVWVARRYGDFRVITVSFAITAVLSILVLSVLDQHNPWPPQFVGLFGFGMACAAWSHPPAGAAKAAGGQANGQPSGHRWGRSAVWLLVCGAASNLVFANSREQIPDVLIGAGMGCALVYLSAATGNERRPLALRLLAWRPLVWLGTFSFSLYLMHAPILALFYLLARRWGLGPVELQLFILCVAVAAAVAASWLFFLLFERPVLCRRAGARLAAAAANA